MSKKNICMIFGGVSNEHDVSLRSVTTLLTNIDKEKYNVYPVGITKDGRWYLYTGDVADIVTGEWEKGCVYPAFITPNTDFRGLTVIDNGITKQIGIDCVFPMLHGKNGEDGTIQGLLALCGLPFVGCGHTSSSLTMDKAFTKLIVESQGIRQADYVILKSEKKKYDKGLIVKAEEKFGYPMFVKPCNSGSSVGVYKANCRAELERGIESALNEDSKLLIEEAVDGAELECAVLRSDGKYYTEVGEILPDADFYTYDDKYNNSVVNTTAYPDISDELKSRLTETAVKIFDLLDCRGLSRVDFFADKKTGEIVFNEINTIPGFTSISMYPILMEKLGIKLSELIDKLIETGLGN